MTFKNIKAVADSNAKEIARDVLTRVVDGIELERLLHDAAALGFLAGCQRGADVTEAIYASRSGAPN